MKILLADAFPESHQRALSDDGHELTAAPTLEGDALKAAIADHEVLVVRGTKVTADIIAAGAQLKLIIRAGAGTNTIDKAHAAESGVRVCNVPGANAVAVAELVMGLIIAIDRNIAANVHDLRDRRWNKKTYGKARGLHGMTVGLFGLGAIGLAVAARAHAFGMKLCTPARPKWKDAARDGMKKWDIAQIKSQDELLAQCDVISFHLPLTADTENIANANFFAAMKDGAILINTARGDLVDEAALIAAMDSKGIRAGLDVYQNEPAVTQGEFKSALANHPNVCGTHHIGASTTQAQNAVADGVIRVITAFGKGELLYCVNE